MTYDVRHFDSSHFDSRFAKLLQTMAPKNAMKAMKTMKAMKKGKFLMKVMKAMKAKKKLKEAAERARLRAAGYRYDGRCPDTGIRWWVHRDDERFIDRGYFGPAP